ncbi:MAG: phosphate/phosphite/phosphonate ABC transporter substrate-binding protein [Desulfobulbaceae bacterium]|nr:phosphate/phosphite/phosphonate ABC transporter substrate-binding protein [Desulfobulbaceae bacterium]
MRKIFFILSVLVLSAFPLALIEGQPRCFAHDSSNVIKFGVYPYESPRSVYTLYAPLARRIEAKTGKKVELVSAPDQETFIERTRQGAYDLALVSPVCFFKVQDAGYHVIARGKPSFYGGVIVRSDSGITSAEQLRKKKVAAIGQYSYGGYLFFRQELAGLGISPDRDVQFSFLDKVNSVIFGVLNKQYDAGILRIDTLNRPEFIAIRDKVRIISRSPEIPQFPFVVMNNLSEATVQLILEVMTAISPENLEGSNILTSLQIDRIVAARDSDYDAFRRVIKEVE